MAPPQQPSGGRTPADDEAEKKRKELAAMSAMMVDDLCNARQNELPLEDKHEDERGNRKRGGGANYQSRPTNGFRGVNNGGNQNPRENQRHGPSGANHHGHQGHHANSGRNDSPSWARPASVISNGDEFRARNGIHGYAIVDPDISQMWKDAYSAGVFQDQEAEAVKNLDDLGGGRIHATARGAQQPISREERARGDVRRILEHGSARSRRPVPVQAGERMRSEGTPNHAAGRNNAPGPHQPQTSSQRAPSGPFSAASTNQRPQAINSRPQSSNFSASARPTRLPQSRPLPSTHAPVVAAEPVLNEHVHDRVPNEVCGKPDNTIFKITVDFSSRTINPQMSAVVFLSAATRPELGVFTVVIHGRMHCQWPISAWYDYSTGADRSLCVTFKEGDGDGVFQTYQLFFTSDKDLKDFMDAMRTLQSGTSSLPSTTNSTVTGGPSATDSVVTNRPAVSSSVQVAASTGSQGTQNVFPSTFVSNGSVGNSATVGGLVATTESKKHTSAAASATSSSPLSDITNGVDGTLTLATPIMDEPEQNDFIHLATQDGHTTSEAPGLLAMLEPRPGTDYAGLLPGQYRAFCRRLMQVFLWGKNKVTKEELDQTARGIESGLLDFILDFARARGLSTQSLQNVEDSIRNMDQHRGTQYSQEELMPEQDSEVDPPASLNATTSRQIQSSQEKHAAVNPTTSLDATTSPRIQYSQEEMMSRRHAAVDPSASLPQPQTLRGIGKLKPEDLKTQISRSANAMQWAQGKAEWPKPAPKPAPKQTRPVVPSVTAARATRDVDSPKPKPEQTQPSMPSAAGAQVTQDQGLQKSRWASGVEQTAYANYFTGPAYEKAWPQRSYMKELAQLDPQATVTAGDEDLIDFYFPPFRHNDAQVGWAGPQGPGMFGNTANGFSVAGLESSTSKIGGLKNEIPATGSQGAGMSGNFVNDSSGTRPESTTARTDSVENLRVGISRLTLQSPSFTPAQPVLAPLAVQPPQVASAQISSQASAPSSVTSSSTQSVQPPAAQPGLRGLAASRHSSGTAPGSSGKFDFVIPKSARQ